MIPIPFNRLPFAGKELYRRDREMPETELRRCIYEEVQYLSGGDVRFFEFRSIVPRRANGLDDFTVRTGIRPERVSV